MKMSLHQYFGQLPDPRIQRNKKHLLIDIIVLSIISVICGAESWDSIEMFGKSKKDFLSKILRGSRDGYHEKSAIHTVNAWANSNGLVLGQVKTKEKSTEITAIPELLSILDIEGCIVTIDAMGTQKKIAEKIIEEKADYILALKENQAYLKEDVESTFLRQKPDSVDETVEKGHGRLETRKCEVINTLDFLDQKEEWSGLNTLARITAPREIKGAKTTEVRLYISSVDAEAKEFNAYIRQHRAVENSLHWTLDMTFREDAQRKRKGMAANNFALIQKITLNLLRKEESKNMSLKNKRLVAAWE